MLISLDWFEWSVYSYLKYGKLYIHENVGHIHFYTTTDNVDIEDIVKILGLPHWNYCNVYMIWWDNKTYRP